MPHPTLLWTAVSQAVFLADENDGQLDHNLRDILNTTKHLLAAAPDMLTYQGGKTNRHNGAYSGICDVQVRFGGGGKSSWPGNRAAFCTDPLLSVRYLIYVLLHAPIYFQGLDFYVAACAPTIISVTDVSSLAVKSTRRAP